MYFALISVSRKRKRRRRTLQSDGDGDGDVFGYSDVVETPMLGGSWRPSNCTPRHRIALIVPYRNREPHLTIFLSYMHPFLQRQMLDYTIYVVEQVIVLMHTINRNIMLTSPHITYGDVITSYTLFLNIKTFIEIVTQP